MQSITIGTLSYSLVSMPATPGVAAITLAMNDTVASVQNPFTLQTQTQSWPGADFWELQITMPPMPRKYAAAWLAFLAELRGATNVFQMGDPTATSPLGTATGLPVVNMSGGSNAPMTTTLYTRGWTNNSFRLLLPGDYLQVGYRLHMVCEAVQSDSSGNAAITIWPSIRDTLTDGQAVLLSNTKGLFRLAQGKRQIQSSPAQLTTMSFNAVEVR